MSADNGIYILKTVGPEWRVAHLMAIENLDWDAGQAKSTDNPDVHIDNARNMFGSAHVFDTSLQALIEADRQYEEIMKDDFPVLEYGISHIEIDRKF